MSGSQDVLDLLRQHGRNATSFQALEPGIEHWLTESGDACVAYTDTGSAWVALGEPIAPRDRVEAVMVSFRAAADAKGRRVRFFALEAPAPPATKLRSLVVGEQAEWSVSAWKDALASKRSLREQLRRARAKGVRIERLDSQSIGEGEQKELIELASAWKSSKSMAPMRFAVTLDLFGTSSERRYFFARERGTLVGALVAVPIYAKSGWLVEDLLRTHDAPNGTTELLFDAAMRELGSEGAEILSMGMAPLSAINSRPLRLIRWSTRWLFDWVGLRAFKAKLLPQRWQPVYAGYPVGERGLTAIADVLRCFAGGSLVAFAGRTLVHRHRAVLWLLAVLLIPWTAALATGAAARFFPSPEVQAGWIVYDAALFAGIAGLATHFSRPLAQLLAMGAALDVVGGAVQVATWNAERATGTDWILILLAIAAPAIAFIFLVSLLWRGQASPVAKKVAT